MKSEDRSGEAARRSVWGSLGSRTLRARRGMGLVLAAGLAATIWGLAALRIPRWQALSSPTGDDAPPTNSDAASSDPCAAYILADGRALHFVPFPDDLTRLRLLEGRIRADPRKVVSLTVVWGDRPYVRSAVVGDAGTPRSLHDVLLDSLGLPPYLFERLEVSHDIGLPGDWVLREGAQPTEFLLLLAQIVRDRGHTGFAFVPEDRLQPVYTAQGTPCSPAEPLELLPRQPQHEPEAPLQRGSVNDFLEKLSMAVHRRIRSELVGGDRVQVAWRDYSRLRASFGAAPTESAVAQLMEQVAAQLQVDFRESSERFTVWRLCDDCYPRAE